MAKNSFVVELTFHDCYVEVVTHVSFFIRKDFIRKCAPNTPQKTLRKY